MLERVSHEQPTGINDPKLHETLGGRRAPVGASWQAYGEMTAIAVAVIHAACRLRSAHYALAGAPTS